MAETDDPTFHVERESLSNQAVLVPEFQPTDLAPADQARFGHLHNRYRGRDGPIVLPAPFGTHFDNNECVSLTDVYRRLSDVPRASTDPKKTVMVAIIVACVAVVGTKHLKKRLRESAMYSRL